MKRQSRLLKRRQRRLRNSIALQLVKNRVSTEELMILQDARPLPSTRPITDFVTVDRLRHQSPAGTEDRLHRSDNSDIETSEHLSTESDYFYHGTDSDHCDKTCSDNSGNECSSSTCEETSNSSESTENDSISELHKIFEHDYQSCSDTEILEKQNTLPIVNHDTIPSFDHAVNVGLLSIMDKHSLSYASIADMLKLMSASIPQLVPTSLYMLLKEFSQPKDSMKVHRCCGSCTKLLNKDSNCTTPECIAQGLPASSFIEVKLAYQLQLLFTDPNFLKLLQYRFKRMTTDSLCDMYDGNIYKECPNFFIHPYNLSFTLNYDGAPKFKSSTMQMWPIQLRINELPPVIRNSRRYSLLAGLWCSKQKPSSFSFLEPTILSLQDMEKHGVMVTVQGQNQLVKAQLICAVMDLPAKAALLNVIQYNGEYGCSTCNHPGSSVSVGRGTARAYKFHCDFQMRNHETHEADAKKALEKNSIICGVKGYSPLHLLPSFDMIRCVPVDYMHAVLLGVTKKLATLWFNTKNSKEEWYIGRKAAEVDARMCNIKMPSKIMRSPRSITERSFWKASEWKSFLLYYIPAALHGILPMKYFLHVFLLIKALRILLNESIERNELKLADRLFSKFCKLMETYYGLKNCGINIHILRHLTFYVECLGPLWTHSAFSFEGQMFNFLKTSHASHGIEKQIVTSYLIHQRLCIERQIFIESNQQLPLRTLFADFQNQSGTEDITMLGRGQLLSINANDLQAINSLLLTQNISPIENTQTSEFFRVKVKNNVFCTRHYKRMQKRDNSTVKFMENAPNYSERYGIIEKFLVVDHNYKLAIITNLKIVHKGVPFQESDMTQQTAEILFEEYLTYEENHQTVVFIHQIVDVCCNLSQSGLRILTWFPNNIEIN